MNKQENGDVLFSMLEVKSLARVLESVDDLIWAMPSDGGDLLGGEDNWFALLMWKDVLVGREYELSRYFGSEEEEQEEEEKEDTVETVMEWLTAYGEEEE